LRCVCGVVIMADKLLYDVVSTFGKAVWSIAEPVIDRVFPVSETARRRVNNEVRTLMGDNENKRKSVKISYPLSKKIPLSPIKYNNRTKKMPAGKRKYRKRVVSSPKRKLIYQDTYINRNPKWNIKRFVRRFANNRSFYGVR